MDDAPPGGFWGRVESRVQALVADRERLARCFTIGYWISTGVVVVGAVVIVLSLWGGWRP